TVRLCDTRRWSPGGECHPLLAVCGLRATGWLLVADALAGDAAQVLTGGVRFLDGWRRAASPAGSVLGPPAAAVATIHGLRGDEDACKEWNAVLGQVDQSPAGTRGYGAIFAAILLLHRGQAAEALERLAPEPGEVWQWITWTWLHWYVALRAEATVLSGAPRSEEHTSELQSRENL